MFFFAKQRILIWSLVFFIFLFIPIFTGKGFALSVFIQMAIAIIFALSYNMLLGQTGLLSFGHAVYYGMGAFIVAHTINFINAKVIWMPIALTPLIGGIFGLFLGFIIGVVTTRKPGTPFAMISLGIAEMFAASALMFTTFFGGEGGISTDRTSGGPIFGISMGSQLHVYYVVAFWCFVSIFLMYLITKTPLGKMANAVRDNPERVKFIGYNPTTIRWMMLTLSGFFAGIAGGLYIINYEIVTAEALGIMASGNVVLMTFIGGISNFWGPIIGAILVTFLQSALSSFTHAWLLYFGLLFLIIILFSPGGIANIIVLHKPILEKKLVKEIVPSYSFFIISLLVFLFGFIGLIEMLYKMEGLASGGLVNIFGFKVNPFSIIPWVIFLIATIFGAFSLRKTYFNILVVWKNLRVKLQS